jgi:hypothetical protein
MRVGEREARLIKMSVEKAREAQYQHGIDKYGEDGNWRDHGRFIGEPLPHLYTELIDAMNYAEVALIQGKLTPEQYGATARYLARLAQTIQTIYTDRT